MSIDSEDTISTLIGCVKLIAIAFLVDDLPGLIPYALLPSGFDYPVAIINWIARAVAIYFLVSSVRLAASLGAPSHG